MICLVYLYSYCWPITASQGFCDKRISNIFYITLGYSSTVHALYMEILSTWKIKRTIKRKKKKNGRKIAHLPKFHPRAAQICMVPARVCDVEGGAVCSKNNTFGYFDGTAGTLHFQSPTPIMTADNALFNSRSALRNLPPTSLPVRYPRAVLGRASLTQFLREKAWKRS